MISYLIGWVCISTWFLIGHWHFPGPLSSTDWNTAHLSSSCNCLVVSNNISFMIILLVFPDAVFYKWVQVVCFFSWRIITDKCHQLLNKLLRLEKDLPNSILDVVDLEVLGLSLYTAWSISSITACLRSQVLPASADFLSWLFAKAEAGLASLRITHTKKKKKNYKE